MCEIKKKVIIDTDIGDDIDDAFALLLAMEMELDIIGITTVFKNTEERARITKKLMHEYGKGYESTPVYSGYGSPIKSEISQNEHLCQYTSELDDEKYEPSSKNPSDAIDFIIDSCKKYRDELIIIALGPFTNIAKAIERDKDALMLAGKIVIMGGAYFKQYADWNVMCDVEAAKIMLDTLSDIRCVGADVTHKLPLSEEDDRVISTYRGEPSKEYVARLYKAWKNEWNGRVGVLHDPLAVYCAINEDVCSFTYSPIEVISDGCARGITLNVAEYSKKYMNPYYKNSEKHSHFLAKEVNLKLIIEEFMNCFKG